MDVNVFEMAFRENAALTSEPAKPSKKVVESVARKVAKLIEPEKIVKESVQLSKIRFTEDTDEISSVQPDDDIVVVYSDDIKPDMTEEEVEQAAQDLIGATICKCGVCGANYIASEEHSHDDELVVTDDVTTEDEEIPDEFTFTDEEGESLDDIDFADEELGESLLFREDIEDIVDDDDTLTDEEISAHTCPVCDATENQVEVGEIVPTEEASAEPTTDDETVPTETDTDTEEAPVKVDVDVNVNGDDEEEVSTESLEAVKSGKIRRHVKAESKKTVRKTPARRAVKAESAKSKKSSLAFNEKAFSRLLNKFVAENYENVSKVEITSGKATKNNELCFEGKVTAKSGKTRAITFETVGFKYTEGLMKIKMIEKGPFTEAARVQKNAVPFVLECRARDGRVMPTAFKCRYAIKMQNEWFECRGKYTLSESVKKQITKATESLTDKIYNVECQGLNKRTGKFIDVFDSKGNFTGSYDETASFVTRFFRNYDVSFCFISDTSTGKRVFDCTDAFNEDPADDTCKLFKNDFFPADTAFLKKLSLGKK